VAAKLKKREEGKAEADARVSELDAISDKEPILKKEEIDFMSFLFNAADA